MRDMDIREFIKIAILSIVIFFGASFSIMAFHNDISIQELFSEVYFLLTGENGDSLNLLKIGYCIGIASGILIFFNHFGKEKEIIDPTPLQVEMCKYETDVQSAVESLQKKQQAAQQKQQAAGQKKQQVTGQQNQQDANQQKEQSASQNITNNRKEK